MNRNGGPHKFGCTDRALKEIAWTLEKEGVESEIVWLGNAPIAGCIGCGACKGTGKCFRGDIVNDISARLDEFDGFVFGSPVYYGQPNGALLAIIQRAFYSNSANIAGKPAAAIAVCRRGGATATFEALNMPFQMLNMPVVTSQYWNIVYGHSVGQASLDIEGMQTMRTLARNMAWLLKCTNGKPAPGRVAEEPWECMNFIR